MEQRDIYALIEMAHKLVRMDDYQYNQDESKVDDAAQAIWDYVLDNQPNIETINIVQRDCGKGIKKCHPECALFDSYVKKI